MVQKSPSNKKLTGWDVLNNFILGSLSKGQFPFAVIGLLSGLCIINMDSQDIKDVLLTIISSSDSSFSLGWIVSFFLAIGWFISNKIQRRIMSERIDQITKEKSELQERLINFKLDTSRK